MMYCLREETVVPKEGVHIKTERDSFIAYMYRAVWELIALKASYQILVLARFAGGLVV